MSTITKANLNAMLKAEKIRKQEADIQMYVNAITNDILSRNKMGHTQYNKILYKEPDQVKEQIVKQLQSVFIDSKITYWEVDHIITVDWSED